MAVSLPDEIISEILTPVLRVPDQLFSDTSGKGHSPFATRNAESTSAMLLVCKAWLRVSTPLLYHVIILRSTPQAQALAMALKKNPDLGRFIKQLRVEGGFGSAMHSILKSSPNVTDILLSLQLYASDSSAGLVSGLPLINPTRLIISDHEENGLRNRHVSGLMDAVVACVNKWENLTTVVFPYQYIQGTQRYKFTLDICTISRVKVVSFPIHSYMGLPSHIDIIAKIPSIQTIEVRAPTSADRARRVDARRNWTRSPQVIKVLRWIDTSIQPEVSKLPAIQPSDTTFCPMAASAPAVVDVVWARILFFAMKMDDVLTTSSTDEDYARSARSTSANVQYLLVSKRFNNLALPYLHRYLVFSQASRLTAFVDRVRAQPSIGAHVLQLHLRAAVRLTYSEINLSPLFAHASSLQRLVTSSDTSMPWRALVALAHAAGPTLVEFSGFLIRYSIFDVTPDPSVFCRFTALRVLKCSCTVALPALPAHLRATALAQLELLQLEDTSAEFRTLLTDMELPNLRHLIGCDSESHYPMLTRHGAKIHEITAHTTKINEIIAFCPNLVTIRMHVRFNAHVALDLNFPHIHHSLQKFVATKVPVRPKGADEAEWECFFNLVDPAHFPALREIQVEQCVWPASEHAISQSMWVEWAERMLQMGMGIRVTDKDGTHWRPRLKRSRR
ncbi:hypothetical protein DFH06DRAFT_372792 [Mycena polygramma]|nr:hypothetical protein DFH06DRAFT_372792 [Mycena polygramma]